MKAKEDPVASYVYAVWRDHNRHTCIAVHLDDKFAFFIPMDPLEVSVVRKPIREFNALYTPYTEYPVKRAAEIYLNAPSKVVAEEAREHLTRIISDPAFEYDSSLFNRPPIKARKEEDTMATAKKAAAPAKKSEKAAAAEGKPTKASAKAAPAKAAEKGAGRPRDDNATYTIGDDSSVKRGFIADFVGEAKKLGTFSRDKLLTKLKGKAEDEKLLRYFYYCTGKGIIVEAGA